MVIIMVVWWCEHNKTKSGPQPKYVIEQQPGYFNRICFICLIHNVNDAAIHDDDDYNGDNDDDGDDDDYDDDRCRWLLRLHFPGCYPQIDSTPVRLC